MHLVFWDGSITLCNCKNFEFWGILCRHILQVFIQKDCFHTLSCYLPLRWRSEMAESRGEAQELVTEEVLQATGFERWRSCPMPTEIKNERTPKKGTLERWKGIGQKANQELFNLQTTWSYKANMSIKRRSKPRDRKFRQKTTGALTSRCRSGTAQGDGGSHKFLIWKLIVEFVFSGEAAIVQKPQVFGNSSDFMASRNSLENSRFRLRDGDGQRGKRAFGKRKKTDTGQREK
ncbi:hypothetical protein Cgig2_032192 [Carnegiea gigantea]|uniref:SWIM-type domain-containing protein n=1 Tax=Carnegiea gigantea TaxID=171969 RepID=A0A9Q1K4P0_9CARY|nr:hypothetical protein Cgig2_032192 [Carnegiea gigantea]